MLNNGAQAAANTGKPVIVRLGWEANNEGSFPWAATGDGSSWKACFQRWVDILNPVGSTGIRQKRFLVVWNMANRGTITYPIDNLWPGGDYVDIVGSQYYDRCPPLPDGDKYAFEARLDARTHSNNPAGPRAWLEYAKAKGKPYAMPEWGIGGARSVPAAPSPASTTPTSSRRCTSSSGRTRPTSPSRPTSTPPAARTPRWARTSCSRPT